MSATLSAESSSFRVMSAESGSVRPDDGQLFERLYMEYSDPLCRFIYSYVASWETAKDLVDDVFLQFWLRLDGVERDRDLKTYLFTAAKHHAISHLRHREVEARHQRRHQVSETHTMAPALPAAADQRIAAAELTATLQQAIDALPPRQRDVILLKWERQATHEEIGQILDIAPKTVAEHFRRALEQLRAKLPRDLGSELNVYE